LLDGPGDDRAVEVLRTALRDPDPAMRRHAIRVASGRGSGDVADLIVPALTDPAPEVRAAAMLARAGTADPSVLEMAAEQLRSAGSGADASVEALERLGSVAIPAVLEVLRSDPVSDAALEALSRLDASPTDQDGVRAFVEQRIRDAERDMSAVPVGDGMDAWTVLLHDALRARARAHALAAIRAAAALGGDREAVRAAVESLDAGAVEQFASSLEVVEVELAPTLGRSTAQRLLRLWEPQAAVDIRHDPTNGWIDRFRSDDDPLIRDLAARALGGVGVRDEEEAVVRTDVSTVLERTLALRSVPLFAGLDPADLHAVAEVAEDQAFGPGEYLAAEGDLGEDLHLIVHGTVGIEHGDPPHEFARRTAGDVIGEMSLVSRAPRVASAVANTDVRTVRITRAHFESMIRERPSIALSVMRVLAERAGESTVAHAAADHPHA
jgi:HEAT repeat protein